jgi:tRNA(fMet)-specific endonuclease VapC
VILDTTWLIDRERELARGDEGPASMLLTNYADEPLALSFTIIGELSAGRSLGQDRAKWEAFIRPFHIYGFDREVAWVYGNIYRQLREKGELIGANDLWIAATALANQQALVTRNVSEFSRVPDLEVVAY